MTPDQREEMRDLFRSVANRHGLDEADLYVRDRSAPVSAARNEAWGLCRKAGYSYPVIAALGGWDHTSVMHGAEKVSIPCAFKSRRVTA